MFAELKTFSSIASNNGIDIAPSNAIRSTLGAVEMAALEGKLQLLQIQRELSAVRCQGFIEMIQSSLLAKQEEAAAKSAVKSAVKSGARSSGGGDAVPDGGIGADPRLARNSIEPLILSRRQSRQLFRHMSLDLHPTAGNQTWREDLSFYDEPTSCSPRVQGHGGNAASHGSPSRLRGSPRHRSPRHASARAHTGACASPRALPQSPALPRPGSPLIAAPGARQLPLTPRTSSAASPRVAALANSSLRRHPPAHSAVPSSSRSVALIVAHPVAHLSPIPSLPSSPSPTPRNSLPSRILSPIPSPPSSPSPTNQNSLPSPTSLPSRRSPRRPCQRLETPSRRPPLSHLVAPLVALANAPKLPPYAHPLSHPVAPLVALANAPKLPPVAHPLSHPIAPLVPRFKRLKTPSRRPPLSHPVAPLVALANASKLPPVAHPSPISSLPSSPSPTPRNSLRTRILSPIPSLPSSPSPTPRNFLPSRILSPIPSLPSSPVSNASKLPPVAHLSPIPSLPSSPSPTPRNSLPSPLLSLRSPCSLSIALALSPSPLLSLRRPCFLSVALALSPSPLLSLRRPCPLSVAPALSPSPLLSLRRHFSLPSRVLSPVALSLSRCPFSLSLPFHPPVTLPLSRRLSSPPSPFLSPGALALSRFLSSLPSSHVALDAVVTFPLSPPVTHLGAFALGPKCLQVALCFSPPISQHPTVPHVSLYQRSPCVHVSFSLFLFFYL
ncbi:unnamed protein product [Closterium sp. Yama58-4]|nr:unnamed protein product [Closterium sp. Yama58-4]